jgi:hypothetical protein
MRGPLAVVDLSFVCTPFCFHGRLIGHAVQPARDRLGLVYASSPASEHKKGGLKGVFRILFVMQKTPANAPNQSSVPSQEGRKSAFIPLRDVVIEQLRVGQAAGRRGFDQVVDMPKDRFGLPGSHSLRFSRGKALCH